MTTVLGRNRRIPELASTSLRIRGYGERLVKNPPCQAGAGDVIRGAMIQVDLDAEAGGLYGTMGRMAYGMFEDGVYRVELDQLPIGWQHYGLPAVLIKACIHQCKCGAHYMRREDHSKCKAETVPEWVAVQEQSLGELGRLGFRMILQCHDELLFRGPKKNAELAKPRIKAIMEDPFGPDLKLACPLVVNIKSGGSWANVK